jgi:hypothetical protein
MHVVMIPPEVAEELQTTLEEVQRTLDNCHLPPPEPITDTVADEAQSLTDYLTQLLAGVPLTP